MLPRWFRSVPRPHRPVSLRPRSLAHCLRLEPLETRVLLTTYTVTTNADSGGGSLRQAIMDSNSNGGPNEIHFSIGSGVQTINLLSELPAITTPVTIDGTSQPGTGNTPRIELNGSGAGSGANGLHITAGNSTVKGLALNRFGGVFGAIELTDHGGDTIVGNFIGSDVTGTQPLGNAAHGVLIIDIGNNTVGGTTPGAGNLISANGLDAIQIIRISNAPTGNVVQGNLIGTDVTGTVALANHGDGINLLGCANTLVGGTVQGAGNVISGNTATGVSISPSGATGSTGNLVQGNLIGTTAAGTTALGNDQLDVAVFGAGTSNNVIGGTVAGARNVISASVQNDGVGIFGGATGNTVEGNYIGTDAAGTVALGSGFSGVAVADAGTSNNTIGGTVTGARNLISGNLLAGIQFFNGPSGNFVQGNYIGTDFSGTQPLGNTYAGVALSGTHDNTVGGTAPGAGNLISGNIGNGVRLELSSTTGNLVEGNWIGTDVTGTVALGNGTDGLDSAVLIDAGASNNTVGGTAAGARNVISADGLNGVRIRDSSGNFVQGDFIGTDVTGTAALGNAADGVAISGSATGNLIGGTDPAAGNVIAANAMDGVHFFGGATGNTVQGNFIGTDLSGTLALGNGLNGAHFEDTSNNNFIAGNVVGYSGNDGVLVDTATGDLISQNSIHDSGNLGIELVNSGNNGQAAPALTSASSDGSSTTIVGTLASTPATIFTLEFFANAVPNPSGSGEGQQYLGSWTVTTDDSGSADFTATFASGDTSGQWVSATATDPGNNTSAFAQDVLVNGTGTPAAGRSPVSPDALAAGLVSGNGTAVAPGGGLPAAGQPTQVPRAPRVAVDAALSEAAGVGMGSTGFGADHATTAGVSWTASSGQLQPVLLDAPRVDQVFADLAIAQGLP